MDTSNGLKRCHPRLGVCESTTARWSVEEDVNAYAAAGVRYIGLWLQKLEGVYTHFQFPTRRFASQVIRAVGEALDDAGLKVSHLAVAGMYTECDPSARDRRVAYTVAALEWAEALGAGSVLILPGNLNGLARDAAVDVAASTLQACLDRSAGCAVRLGIEPIKESDLVRTLEEALDLVELLDGARTGVYVDAFQLWRDEGLMDGIARASGRICGVHIADARQHENRGGERLVPGDGDVPIDAMVAAIEATGYSGSYDVELLSFDEPPETTSQTLKRAIYGGTAILERALGASISNV